MRESFERVRYPRQPYSTGLSYQKEVYHSQVLEYTMLGEKIQWGKNQGENGGKHPNLVREIALVLNNLRKSISLTGTAFKTMGEIRGKLVKGDLIQLYICEIALVLDYPKKNIYLTQVLVNVIIEDKYNCWGGGQGNFQFVRRM